MSSGRMILVTLCWLQHKRFPSMLPLCGGVMKALVVVELAYASLIGRVPFRSPTKGILLLINWGMDGKRTIF